jgi:hypothetical protein
MRGLRVLAGLACAAAHGVVIAAESPPAACANFLGLWSGTWSQGFYGTQRIHVTHVSDQCVATLVYLPTEAPSEVSYQVPIEAGVMAFGRNAGGACRLELTEGGLQFTYTAPSGWVNVGTFRKER